MAPNLKLSGAIITNEMKVLCRVINTLSKRPMPFKEIFEWEKFKLKKIVYFLFATSILFTSCSEKNISELRNKIAFLNERVRILELENNNLKINLVIGMVLL